MRLHNRSRSAAVTHYIVALSALLIALSAWTGAASAQTTFQANVTFTGTLPFYRAGGCANGAFFCGTANIAGYGPASWDFYLTGNNNVDSPCGSTYTAVTQFTLVNDPSSTLVLDEAGNLCGLGRNGAAYRGYFAEPARANGHPYEIVGSWTVDPASTGQFSGIPGSGTDLVDSAGAHASGTYSGTLG